MARPRSTVCNECGVALDLSSRKAKCPKHQAEYMYWWIIKNKYNLSRVEYEAIQAAQGGGCSICGRVPTYRLVVDHNHSCCAGNFSCGQCIRGLLCQPCNVALAAFGDTLEGLARAVNYLETSTNV